MRLVAFILTFSLLSSAAGATDLPSPTTSPPPALMQPVPIAYNWSGFYFGAHGGYGFGSGNYDDGAIAGGQLGVNWQYGRFVVGFEGQGSWVDWGAADALGTGTARAGFAFDRLLLYGSAGLSVRDGVDRVGWVAGAGAEYAVTDHWSVGLEYMHFDLAGDDSETVRARANYLLGGPGPQYGGDLSHGGVLDEVRLGGAGFWQDNASTEEGVYVQGQVLFDPFLDPFQNWILDVLLRPRPHIGGSGSASGTDQVFAGLTWTVPIWRRLFAEASFGGTVHNGPISGAQVSLGCRALFRESLALGFEITEHWRVVAGVDHSSHAELCSGENDGLTHVGGAVGYRF